jgi:hypothetical protein
MLSRAREEGESIGDESEKEMDILSVVVMRSGCATGGELSA